MSESARSLLQMTNWAELCKWSDSPDGNVLRVATEALDVAMPGTAATGRHLVGDPKLGADLIRVPAGCSFPPHIHRGSHVLIVVAGLGTVTYGGVIQPTRAGQIYFVGGYVPHAVGAITDHVILSIGSPHAPVGSPDRMLPVDYKALATDTGPLTCLICGKSGHHPGDLRRLGCPHDPSGHSEAPDVGLGR